MYSRSDPSLLGNPMEQPPESHFNTVAQSVPHIQLVQAVPFVHPVYPQGVPVVLSPARMPVTLLQPPVPVSPQPPTTKADNRQYTPNSYVTNSTVHAQVSSANAAATNDALQRFVERAEKSGIKLEALPEPVQMENHTVNNYSEAAGQSSQSTGIQVPCASVNQPPVLNISSPAFVPRGQMAATLDMNSQYNANNNSLMPSESGAVVVEHCDPHVVNRSTSGMSDPYNAGDVLSSYSGRKNRNSRAMTTGYYLPTQQFANITLCETPRPPGPSYRAPRRRDAFSQTANAKLLVNVGVGESFALMVDASTNTPHYDEASGFQQTQLRSEPSTDTHSYYGTSHPNQTSLHSLDIEHRVPNRSSVAGSHADRWAECWHQGQSPASVKTDQKSKNLFTVASKTCGPSATNCAASRRESSDIGVEDFDGELHGDTLPTSSGQSGHEMSCDCMLENCPFASPTLGVNSSAVHTQSADVSGNSLAASHEAERGAARQTVSPSEYETVSDEEDLSDQVYYSDEDADNVLGPVDVVATATSAAENLPGPQQREVHLDHTALLSQLTNGEFPSPATIELAIAQLMDALTADEKQLMTQLMQQMAIVNPILGATNPLALQVEAIRVILTTRGQMTLLQQMAFQTQLQSLPLSGAGSSVTASLEQPSVPAQAEPCPALDSVSHQEEPPSHTRHRRPSDEPVPRLPGQNHNVSVVLGSDHQRHPDEYSSASSDHGRLDAGPRMPKGRGLGRGRSLSGVQYDDEVCRQERPRGRGMRRHNISTNETHSLQPGNGSASVHQPLVPPPAHAAEPVRRSNDSRAAAAVDDSEHWEEEIDEFGTAMFDVHSSFFKSGKR